MFDQKTIHGAPLLPDEDARELVKRWQEKRDNAARSRVCNSYYRLALGVARSYPSAKGRHFEDAVQEGMRGLLRAIDKYDGTRGVKFSTYAPIWVHAYVRTFLRDHTTTVRIPQNRNSRKVFSNLGRLMAEMHANGEEVTAASISEHLEVPLESVERTWALLASHRMASLDDPNVKQRPDVTHRTPEDEFLSREGDHVAEKYVERIGKALSDREREILHARILADEPATLQELGTRWGVSKERIRQLERRIRTRLKSSARSAA